MAKYILSDIIKKKIIKAPEVKAPVPAPAKNHTRGRKGRIRILYWIIGVVAFFILFLWLSSYFSSVTVKITPKQGFTNIDFNLEANKSAATLTGLAFETIQMEYEQSQEVTATGSVDGGQKASGVIAIYNTYPSKSQKLIVQTRFESPDGKIYRIQEAIIVPASGSIEAKVYADKQGPEYNIKLVDFTIPGFKGAPSYQKIYGRSKTEMTGGFLGKANVVSEGDLNSARNNLKPIIEKYLKENIVRQKPEGYILYGGAIKIDFADDPAGPKTGDKIDSQDKKFIFKEKGAATGYLIKKDNLSKEVTVRYLSSEKNPDARMEDLEKLDFKLINDFGDSGKIFFNLKGAAHIIWNIDKTSLLNNLISADNSDYASILAKYPLIEQAEIIFKPFWWRKISTNPSHIRFEEVLKEK
ncbi:MAG: hypothetical protein WC587_00375 [Candidatus Paceibacterota bacterium]